jgi:uncharacterized protein YneF (UPF0154 family)
MMDEENNKKASILKKIKNAIILILVALSIGLAAGYYIGYDVGFEKAVRILTK